MAERDKMETITATHAYTEYQGTARLLASLLVSYSELDRRGCTRDDYQQDLRLKAVDAADSFQKKIGFSIAAERRFTRKAMWNKVRSWQRDQKRHGCFLHLDFWDAQVDERTPNAYWMDDQIEARLIVQRLDNVLADDDKTLLARLAESGGDTRDAWIPDTDGALPAFRKRVSRLRARVKKIAKR